MLHSHAENNFHKEIVSQDTAVTKTNENNKGPNK